MDDFEDLRARVEATAERLVTTQAERRERNHSLLDTLARLEDKFAAQEKELAFYQERVHPLETANAQLCELMRRLLDMMDAGLDDADDPDDPLRRAAAKGAAMLVHEMALPESDDGDSFYEDAMPAALAAEDAAEADDLDADALPPMVLAARDEARAPSDTPADDGKTEGNDPLQPSAGDIRALLERVEAAARATSPSGSPLLRPTPLRERRSTGAAA